MTTREKKERWIIDNFAKVCWEDDTFEFLRQRSAETNTPFWDYVEDLVKKYGPATRVEELRRIEDLKPRLAQRINGDENVSTLWRGYVATVKAQGSERTYDLTSPPRTLDAFPFRTVAFLQAADQTALENLWSDWCRDERGERIPNDYLNLCWLITLEEEFWRSPQVKNFVQSLNAKYDNSKLTIQRDDFST